ncbi:MAG: DNA polymerase III subunit alpha, partial [Bacteroidia bacterium]
MCNNHKPFVQLHLHTDASLLDGVTNYKKVIAKAKEYGHPAIGITDHGSAARTFDFWKECKKQGIKPILGLEFYITNDLKSRVSHKEREDVEDKDYHQSVYIKNKAGYLNYNYLTYVSMTDGFYYKPRIDFNLLFERKEGLMITTSCMASKMSSYIRELKFKEAEDLFKQYLYEFEDDFYGELQFNEVPEQKAINDYVIHLCKTYKVKMIIGGDVHYTNPEDNVLQDAVIRSKRDADAPDWIINARKLYFHSADDYYQFNKDLGWNYPESMIDECFKTSIEFSEKVNFDFETGKYHLPKIDTGELTSKEYIEKATWEGLGDLIQTERKYFPNKYTNEVIEKLEQQVEYELKVINDMGLNDYLLIVHDIIKWEKANNIYVGPGRGSAAGSSTAWALGITGLNPLEHGLLFERFINPTRKTMADIDWDSEEGGRDKVLEYLIGKYGRECVVNVPTFGTYKPKSALQAMSRGLRKDTGHDTILMKKITKLDGIEDAKDLVEYFKQVKSKTTDSEILEWINNNEDTIDFGNRLLGQMTSIGTHAGGIVVTPGPIYDYIPVTRSAKNLVAAYKEADGSSKDLTELGILKLDVLGLASLNIMKECVNRIKIDTGEDLNEKIFFLDLVDEKKLDFFGTGNTYGIFQFERAKMFTDRMTVDSFEDIIAINAMNRPGPLEKYLDKFGYYKDIDKGIKKVSKEELERVNKERYPFEFMRKALSPTYGCLLYQEQFMQLVSDMTGMTFGEADSFRRAIAWKEDNPKFYTVKGYFDALEKSMIDKGYTKTDCDNFVKYCRDFMGYSFNKSHSTTYAYVAWQLLHFKVYYPAYFYAAMINNANNLVEIQAIISDAKNNNITILAQSVKESEYKTRATDLTTVRLGFGMIKGFGDSTIESCNQFRNYSTLNSLLNFPAQGINKTQFQNLIELGAFDDYNVDRDLILSLKEIFQDEKIENWFTRKKQPLRIETFPKSLEALFSADVCLKEAMKAKKEYEDLMWAEDPIEGFVAEKPWVKMLNNLISTLKINVLDKTKITKDTIKKQSELMGFSLVENPLLKLEETLKIKGLKPLTEYDDKDEKYYFVVEKITKSLTKTGKTFLQLGLNNGIKAKCWRDIELEENEVYYGLFKKDNFGFT